MAHGLTMNGKMAEMAYAGETPWHGLGQKLEYGASMDAWRIAAGMNWEIESADLLYRTGEEVNTFGGKKVLLRSDNGLGLSVVSDRYKVVQPSEALDFFTDLVSDQGFQMHTAGTLFGGKKFWALAKMEEERFVANNKDGIGGFVLLCTSCDGSLATTAKFTSIAVVCNNTLSYSLRDKQNQIRTTHGTTFDAGSVKQQLGLAREEYDSMMKMAEQLAAVKMTRDDTTDFFKFLFTNSRMNTSKAVIEESKGFQTLMALADGGAMGGDLSTREGTAWGALNCVTEYVDHHAGQKAADKRMSDAWFGWGNSVKNAAASKLLELV